MPDLIPNQSLGSYFAQNLGTGLGQGLQALAQHKLNEISQQKEVNEGAKFWKSLGLDDQTAFAFASSPKEVQKSLLDRLEGANIGQQSQPIDQMSQIAQQPTHQGMLQQNPQLEQQLSQVINQPQQPGQITLGPNPLERRHRETLAQQKELAQHKAAKDILHEANQKAKSAKESLRDLDRLEELQKSGKLDSPGFHEFLTRSGLDISALRSPESEEFQKIQANSLRNLKDFFGARITNLDVENFLKSIPTLSNSNQGRARIFANLKRLARGEEQYAEAFDEILKENKGVPPFNIEYQALKRVEKRLDRIAEEFKKDLAKPFPKEQNKLVTALQTGAGQVVGNLGKGLAGAAGGAYLGSRLGVPGAIAGGIGGGLAGLSGVGVKSFL